MGRYQFSCLRDVVHYSTFEFLPVNQLATLAFCTSFFAADIDLLEAKDWAYYSYLLQERDIAAFEAQLEQSISFHYVSALIDRSEEHCDFETELWSPASSSVYFPQQLPTPSPSPSPPESLPDDWYDSDGHWHDRDE